MPSAAWAATRVAYSDGKWRRCAKVLICVRGIVCSTLRGARAAHTVHWLTGDERFQLLAGELVAHLHGRALHEVRRRRQDRPAETAVLGDLAATQCVDDDTGG